MPSDQPPEENRQCATRRIYDDTDVCMVADPPHFDDCGKDVVVTHRNVLESVGAVHLFGYCEEHRGFIDGN